MSSCGIFWDWSSHKLDTAAQTVEIRGAWPWMKAWRCVNSTRKAIKTAPKTWKNTWRPIQTKIIKNIQNEHTASQQVGKAKMRLSLRWLNSSRPMIWMSPDRQLHNATGTRVTMSRIFSSSAVLRSGFLSREEFLAVEMRLHYEDGQARAVLVISRDQVGSFNIKTHAKMGCTMMYCIWMCCIILSYYTVSYYNIIRITSAIKNGGFAAGIDGMAWYENDSTWLENV